ARGGGGAAPRRMAYRSAMAGRITRIGEPQTGSDDPRYGASSRAAAIWSDIATPPARSAVESHKKRRAGRASTAGGLARGAFTPLRSLFLDTGLLVRPIFSTHYVLNNNDLSA